MELTHNFTVPVSIEEAWSAFNDLEQIAPCFPGAALTSFDGERFEGLCKVKLGPISLQYTGSGRFVERDEASKRAVIEAKGRDKRGNGTAAAAVTAQLVATGQSTTAVEVTTNLDITGRPAQFGRGVMQDVSDRLLAQFSACLEDQLGSPPSEVAATHEGLPPRGTGKVEELSSSVAGQPSIAGLAVDPAPRSADHPADAVPQVDNGPTHLAELKLGSAVLPVLLRRYGPMLIAAITVIVVMRRVIGRR